MSKYKDCVYIVELEYKIAIDDFQTKIYPFNYTEDALNFVNKITRTQKGWEKYNCPANVYLMQAEVGKEYIVGEQWIAAWYDIDRMLKKSNRQAFSFTV